MPATKNTAEVRLGAPDATSPGYIYRAPLGTTLPTSASAAANLDPAFINQGYISEDGVSMTHDGNVIKIRDWNSDVIASIEDETSVTLTITLMQRSEASLKTLYGDANVTATTGGKVSRYAYTGGVLPHSAWVFLLKDGAGAQALVIPDAQVTGIGDVKLVKKEVFSQEITVEVYRSAAGYFWEMLVD